jgi:hypothetical protein
MTFAERELMRKIVNLQRRLLERDTRIAALRGQLTQERRQHERRVAYLERDKEMAIERARQAERAGAFWHGVALDRERAA